MLTLTKLKSYASIIVVISALPMMTACSSGDEGDIEHRYIANSLIELFVTALDDPLLQDSDREVLERARVSGRIEQADYDEAYSRFEQCTATAGEPVKLTKLSNGLYRVETTPLSEGESLESAVSIVNKCQMGTTGVLAALYAVQQGNPELLADPYEIAQKCLVAKGLADVRFSHEDLSKIMGSPGPAGVPLEERLPFDPYGDEAQACFVGANIAMVKAR